MQREPMHGIAKAGRTRVSRLVFAFLLLKACALPAQERLAENLTLLGHGLGESLQQAIDGADFRCAPAEPASALRCAALRPGDFRVAQTVPDEVLLHFADDRLIAIEARFQESTFSEVEKHLHATHGPSREESERLRGGMGGYFENAIYLWDQDGAVLRLEQYAAGINTSSVILASATRVPQFIVPKRVDPASGLKDL